MPDAALLDAGGNIRSPINGYGNNLSWYRQAVGRDDLSAARGYAREIREEGQQLGLHDALELLLLLAGQDDPDLEAASSRWLQRFIGEDRELVDVDIAAAALQGLRRPETRPRSELVLRDLLLWLGDPREVHQRHAQAIVSANPESDQAA